MNRFISSRDATPVGAAFRRVEHSLLAVPNCRDDFIQAAAEYFVQTWMASALPRMMQVCQDWANATPGDKEMYQHYLDAALFEDIKLPSGAISHELKDDPQGGWTKPLGSFAENMLRWTRSTFEPDLLLTEPAAPQPTGAGLIDMIELLGSPRNYASMRVMLWESKGSDNQVCDHNSKVYEQLRDYPRRFYPIANAMCHSYSGGDPDLRRFLRDMATHMRNRAPQVHYGVFMTYDANIRQSTALVPNLASQPPDHPATGAGCHHLWLLAIPNFRQLRLDVWRSLHLTP